MSNRRQLGIVGSGFAGSILARIARRLGFDVVLIERGRHPRFALGESTTPLANLALRRLSDRYGLADLRDLASYGRWLRSHPRLRRGLKRGFTFYAHRPGEPFSAGVDNQNRLLVAASPDDEVADSHWLRADVDAHLVDRARSEGVEVELDTEVTAVRRRSGRLGVEARSKGGGARAWEVDLLVDATGARGGLARLLPEPPGRRRPGPRSSLVYGHFAGLESFVDSMPGGAPALEPGPYPDERAAIHHLIEEGWVYVLPFDHDCASVGWIRPGPGRPSDQPAGDQLRALFTRYPTLARQFAAARELRVGTVDRVQHRLTGAAGAGWALLPHAYAFFDPIFSTGIAWSLLGVERLARLLEGARTATAPLAESLTPGLARYAGLLDAEADRLEELTSVAYRLLARPARLFDLSMLYFAAVSWAEVRQRVDPAVAETAVWEGFLGVGDPVVDRFFAAAGRRLAGGGGEDDSGPSAWARRAIASRNLVGLADPARRNLYPADLDVVIESAHLLGRSRSEMRELTPRLMAV